MKEDRRGQTSSGPLQTLMISLVIIAAATFGIFTFYDSLGSQYGVSLTNESQFTAYQDSFSDIKGISENMSQDLSDASGTDIIRTAVTGGYELLITFLQGIPQLFRTVGITALSAVGLGGGYIGYLYVAVLIVVLFAIVALALKVRG